MAAFTEQPQACIHLCISASIDEVGADIIGLGVAFYIAINIMLIMEDMWSTNHRQNKGMIK